MSNLSIPFPSVAVETYDPSTVGGKAGSLIRLAAAGMPVPPGVVLTTAFFAPWFDVIKASDGWSDLLAADPETWPHRCDAIKAVARALPLSDVQRHGLDELRMALAGISTDGRASWAVRSSSPEEDMASASFAGGYETCLGVRRAGMESAIRHCFASALDARVLLYKREHGFDVGAPRIAVVVQRQVASDVSGIAFSINPLTNDYDEAVIDANWGLGESVVGGQVTPDHFVVDKVNGSVIEATVGAKQTSVWLAPDGGTVERERHRVADRTLNAEQLAELITVTGRIEDLYQVPVDIEWAYVARCLVVLQARPITTYVPLPPEMVTEPGARRVLYGDIALSGGFAINAPISPMGLAWMEESVASLAAWVVGKPGQETPLVEKLWFFAGARMYQNLSNILWLASPQRLAKGTASSDALMAAILATVDRARYRSPTRPRWARFRMVAKAPRILWRLRGLLGGCIRALVAPEKAFQRYRTKVAAYEQSLRSRTDDDRSFAELRRDLGAEGMPHIIGVLGPALAVGLASVAAVDGVVGVRAPKRRSLADQLKLGFPGNVVADMGVALHRLGQRLGHAAGDTFDDIDALAERIERRAMSSSFVEGWDTFLATYGWRGPLEMDVARPRYADDPRIALRQMTRRPDDGDGFDPGVAQQRQIAARRRAYEALMADSWWPRRMMLRRLHRVIECFAGTRDTPKHHNLLAYQLVRRRALREGERLVRAGRLDVADDVFDLTFDDLEVAARDLTLDLRLLLRERTAFIERLDAHVCNFPAVIDSRGRILRPPPRDEKEGELTGMPISPGVVSGPVKVLARPDEKSINRGDVLVAYATDPGWTPLFANAAAVVLEIGGVLQHGAVVAREYGKPCVAGIDQVTTTLRDGQHVEVDGTAGIIRLLA